MYAGAIPLRDRLGPERDCPGMHIPFLVHVCVLRTLIFGT